MYLALTIQILILYQISHCYHQLILKTEEKESLEQCLVDIVLKSSDQRDTIFIINDGLYPYLWIKVIQSDNSIQQRWSFIQNSCTNVELPDVSNKYLKENIVSMFLIQINTAEDLISMLENLQSYYIVNPNAKFLITSMTKFKNRTQALTSIFENLWRANIYNSLVVLPHRNDSSKTNLFTWYPYGRHSCAEDFSKFRRINYCHKGLIQENKELYPCKIPNKFKGCEVKVRTVVWPPFVMKPSKRINNTDKYVFKHGFEIVLMNTIATSMNLNLTYTLSEKSINWGELYENGSATGMQAFLLQNEGDIGLSSQGYTESKLKFFNMAVPYFFEHLVWCVPHANTIPALEKIIVVFSIGSWVLTLIAFAIFSLLVWLLNNINPENSPDNYATWMQNSFGILLGLPIYFSPKTWSVKLPLFFWFIFTMHLNITYKTSLISILTSPVYENQIKTLDEIIETDLRLQFMPTMRKHFNENQSYFKEILEKWIDCVDLNDCMDRVAYTRDSVMLLPKFYLEFVVNKYKKKHGSFIHCFNGNILTYPGSMLMRKGFPLRNRMNVLISRMISAGLVDRWQKDALSINLSLNKTSIVRQVSIKKVITSKEHEPAFICLGLGLLLATMVFVCEMLLEKCKKTYVAAKR